MISLLLYLIGCVTIGGITLIHGDKSTEHTVGSILLGVFWPIIGPIFLFLAWYMSEKEKKRQKGLIK